MNQKKKEKNEKLVLAEWVRTKVQKYAEEVRSTLLLQPPEEKN